MSYMRTKSALRDLHGVEISQGGIDRIMQRSGKSAIEQAAPIQAEIQQSRWCIVTKPEPEWMGRTGGSGFSVLPVPYTM